ncbi:hypothetical protein ACFIOY_03675 [Bradyrhizobium sp. TZ2]
MERAMSEADFDQIVDAVRKEIALPPVADSLAGWRASGERAKTADEKRLALRHVRTPMARVRRLGEAQKRYR